MTNQISYGAYAISELSIDDRAGIEVFYFYVLQRPADFLHIHIGLERDPTAAKKASLGRRI